MFITWKEKKNFCKLGNRYFFQESINAILNARYDLLENK